MKTRRLILARWLGSRWLRHEGQHDRGSEVTIHCFFVFPKAFLFCDLCPYYCNSNLYRNLQDVDQPVLLHRERYLWSSPSEFTHNLLPPIANINMLHPDRGGSMQNQALDAKQLQQKGTVVPFASIMVPEFDQLPLLWDF